MTRDLRHVTEPVTAALRTLYDELARDLPLGLCAQIALALEGAQSQCEEAVRIVRRARL